MKNLELIRYPISHLYAYQIERIEQLAKDRQIAKAEVLRDLLAYALQHLEGVYPDLTPEEVQIILQLRNTERTTP